MTIPGGGRQAVVVVGLGHGDEAKGATVDHLAATLPDAVAVVRWSGGAQAAHTVRHGPRHHTFRQFGSGTLLDVRTVLAAPMTVDPAQLAAEADELAALGVRDPFGLLLADPRCLVTTPLHVAMNRARERARGDARHGSTGLGVGETVAYDLAVRTGVRRGDLVGDLPAPADAPALPAPTLGTLRDRRATVAALDALARYAEPLLHGDRPGERDTDGDGHDDGLGAALAGGVGRIADVLCGIASELPLVDDVRRTVDDALGVGSVVFEGSQGMLLDEWHGWHPHTTWSTVSPRRLVARLEAAGHRPYVLGVTRTYATRHGAGPFPTEDASLHLPEPDNREGRYQGAWRTGHLDLPSLRYASRVAGRVDGVGVSHLDVLGTAPLAVAERWDGEREPLRYRDGEDTGAAARLTARAAVAVPDTTPVPADPEALLALVEDAVGAPVVLTADGPERRHRRRRDGRRHPAPVPR